MADIHDLVTEEQLADLEQANVEFLDDPEPLVHKGNENWDYYVKIHVDESVNQLISPPLCPNCGVKMDDEYYPDQLGGTMHYWCPGCGENVRITRSRE